jgi:hypothetical protein
VRFDKLHGYTLTSVVAALGGPAVDASTPVLSTFALQRSVDAGEISPIAK